MCRENDIILVCLPPHTTHALQPLDVSVFKSLKDHYSKSVRSITFARKNFIAAKQDFSRIIKSPFERAFLFPNIKAGFAKCGIYPFNRDAVPIAKMIPSSLHDSSLWMSSSGSSSDSATQCSSLQVSSSSLSGCLVSSSEMCCTTPITTISVSSTVVCSMPSNVSSVSSTPISVMPICSKTPISVTPVCSTTISVTPIGPMPVNSTGFVPSVALAVCATPSSPVNPLVMAGLIPAEMADILATPSPDAAMTRKHTRRITGGRDLTADDYRGMLHEDKRRKENLELQKIKRMEEREKKKQEREKKKEEIARRKEKKVGKGKGKLQQRPVCRSLILHTSSDSDSDVVTVPRRSGPDGGESSSHRPHRQVTLPSRFRENEYNDGSICTVCGCNEPEGLGAQIVFWIDCSVCGEWAHNVCAFGNNTVTRQYVCKNC